MYMLSRRYFLAYILEVNRSKEQFFAMWDWLVWRFAETIISSPILKCWRSVAWKKLFSFIPPASNVRSLCSSEQKKLSSITFLNDMLFLRKDSNAISMTRSSLINLPWSKNWKLNQQHFTDPSINVFIRAFMVYWTCYAD